MDQETKQEFSKIHESIKKLSEENNKRFEELARMTNNGFTSLKEELSQEIQQKGDEITARLEKRINVEREQDIRRDDAIIQDTIENKKRIDTIDKHLDINSVKLAGITYR